MLAAALVLLHTAGSAPAVWRNYDEVFDFAIVGGRVLTATNGGLLESDGKAWAPVPSPPALRSIEQVRPVVVSTASGRKYVLDGQNWSSCSGGTRKRDLEHGVEFGPEDAWLADQPILRAAFPQPPPAHVYALIQVGSDLLAGTPAGLFRCHEGNWCREALPSSIPVDRPNGIAQVKGTTVIGGMNGLFIGGPGNWKQVCSDAIRQIRRVGQDVWVVHGSGALDRMDPSADQLFPDVMTGASKRPWTSCIGSTNQTLLFGGMGGWSERSDPMIERFPPELAKDVVTAIAGRDGVRWIGTEQSGVIRFGSAGIRRWNPGNGLTDTWVTSLCRIPAGLVVGTMHAGLFEIVGDRIKAISSPTQRVTQVTLWSGQLVAGGMDGSWILRGARWMALPTHGEETTSIGEVGGRLTITTATSVYSF